MCIRDRARDEAPRPLPRTPGRHPRRARRGARPARRQVLGARGPARAHRGELRPRRGGRRHQRRHRRLHLDTARPPRAGAHPRQPRRRRRPRPPQRVPPRRTYRAADRARRLALAVRALGLVPGRQGPARRARGEVARRPPRPGPLPRTADARRRLLRQGVLRRRQARGARPGQDDRPVGRGAADRRPGQEGPGHAVRRSPRLVSRPAGRGEEGTAGRADVRGLPP